ncbi:hypothetical protein [Natrinema pallidum]|nr:hypothetical protein [Natrinema pallidum]
MSSADESSGQTKIEGHRDDLEALAKSDNPAAEIAKAILRATDKS